VHFYCAGNISDPVHVTFDVNRDPWLNLDDQGALLTGDDE